MSAFNRQCLEEAQENYWQKRLLGEIKYAMRLSQVHDNNYDELISSVLSFIENNKNQVITEDLTKKAEEKLSPLKDLAQSYTLLCAAHAHIDMNWMWRWDETVSITLDTFKTILDLMEQYPDFTFSQSQASVYRIMEKYDTENLAEIKQRVQEGRWEVTASTWVEADKNIPAGESMARHILYTKKYLSQLLNIDPDSLAIDFEPDTFGHSINVPEVLTQGGIDYYYHCRGYDGYNLYNWQAPSGKSVLVHREPTWYNSSINIEMVEKVPAFCEKHNIEHMLRVYGVGDHGGGPTRRDIERILDMQNWPIFPQIKFSTFKEYFKKVEKVKSELPVVDHELNFVFTGCYTSQSRIKKGNRKTENLLKEAETFNTISDMCGYYDYNNEEFFEGWEKVLFNQFHDIIPGSGTIETREHAMGKYQDTLAVAGSRRKLALRNISQKINTSQLEAAFDDKNSKESTATGAGVGFGVENFNVASTSRTGGKKRVFHVFNSAVFSRKEMVEFVIWDYQGNKNQIIIENDEGEVVDFQIIEDGFNHYWGHNYIKILVEVEVPACGYSTYLLKEKDKQKLEKLSDSNPRVDNIEEFKLENKYIKVKFDRKNGALTSFIDKATGKEYIDNKQKGIFRIIDEDDSKGMTSWRVGRYMKINKLEEGIKVKKITEGNLREELKLETSFRNSQLKAVIALDKDSKSLDYKVECDWQEQGKKEEKIPQLNYYLPLNYRCQNYKYDIPFGTITREGMNRDVPASSLAAGVPESENQKMLILNTDSKYGFRAQEDSLAVTLIRSSYDPDPYPELGIHEFKFNISLIENDTNQKLINHSQAYNNPLQVISGSFQEGELATSTSFIKKTKGNSVISSIKKMEDKNQGYIIRSYETEGKEDFVEIELFQKPVQVNLVDINENKLDDDSNIKIEGKNIQFKISPYQIKNIGIEF